MKENLMERLINTYQRCS